MAFVVKTTDGATLDRGVVDKAGKVSRELSEARAKARCKEANKKAEELGIKTRYEVIED